MEFELEMLVDDEKLSEISRMYWDMQDDGEFVHSVASLARQFGLSANKISNTVSNSCNAYSMTIECEDCEIPYSYSSRSEYTSKKNQIKWVCESCVRDQSEELNRRKIQELKYSAEVRLESRFSLDSLSFKQSIYLLSLVRYSITEELDRLQTYSSNHTDLLSPSDEYGLGMYRELSRDNLIIVSPESHPGSIELEEDAGFSYYIDRVEWLIPIDIQSNSSIAIFIQDLEAKLSSMEWEDEWYEQAKELCSEIALVEATSYLCLMMSEHKFGFVAGGKTTLVLRKILEQYSVAQAYSLIWGASKDAAAYYMRSGISKKQAANSVVGGLERKFERAVANKWETKPFRRDFRLPMSILSQVLYSTTLQTDDGGFNKTTNEVI